MVIFQPSKMVCVGLNYHDHAKELGMNIPSTPVLFLKAPTSLNKNKGVIRLPSQSRRVDYEAELAIVIGKKCRNVPEKDVKKYVKGFTCLDDVTARDLQKKDGQWTRAKSFDTFCPIGPKVVSWKDFNPNNLKIQTFLNGKIKQDSNTNQFIFSVEEIVSFVSSVMTLLPGDIISTGTPAGIGPMKKGDIVEVRIEKIGSLVNSVR